MRRIPVIVTIAFLFMAASLGAVTEKDNLQIYREFVGKLRQGGWTTDDIRAYYAPLTDAMLTILETIREKAVWEDFEITPETFRVDSQLHFLVPVSIDGGQTLCFTLLLEGDQWYFRHVEAITLRLDQLDSLPTSVFPDIDEAQKIWIREEIRVSNQVRLFNFLVQEKGKAFAFDWFKDGPGYFLAARAWVPFVPPARAFILYLCWEQANLRGQEVVLEKLSDREAVVRMKPLYFALYNATAHLKTQIGFEDYRRIFETTWRDRARASGWELEITYAGEECIFRFDRES
jgi:hypothetical protein